MTRLSQLILMLALSCSLDTAAAQTINLTGSWTGTATPNGPNFQPTGPQPVSASITQTANSITTTLVFVVEGVPQIFTGTGQINGTGISSSDNDVSVSGNISSSNGLLQMSGAGTDSTSSDMVRFIGSFSSNGQHMSGTATSSQGDIVTWSLANTSTGNPLPALLDPIGPPSFLDGPSISKDKVLAAGITGGRIVQGVAADGVLEILPIIRRFPQPMNQYHWRSQDLDLYLEVNIIDIEGSNSNENAALLARAISRREKEWRRTRV